MMVVRSASVALALSGILGWIGCTASDASTAADGGAHPGDDGGGLVPGTDGGGEAGDGGDGGDGGPPDTFAWAQSFTAGQGSDAIAMAADASGVVVAGSFQSGVAFGGPGVDAGDDASHAFVAKLDRTGKVLWSLAASGATSLFEAVVIDPSGDVIVAGDAYGDAPSVTFGGASYAANTANGTIGGAPVAPPLGLLARLDGATGTVKWVKTIESTGEIDLGSIALVGTSIVAAGALDGNAAFGPAETMTITGCPQNGCVYLALFDASGVAQWAKRAASTPARNNAASNPREVWVAGGPSRSIVVAVGGFFAAGEQQSDANQLVVNAYDATGALAWATSAPMPANGGTAVDGLAVDPSSGAAFVLGDHGQGLTLGGTTIDPNGSGEYVTRFGSDGGVAWVTPWDPTRGGAMGLALGDGGVSTFGNADDPRGVLPDTVTSMGVGRIDPASGAPVSDVVCGAAQGRGKVVAAYGDDVYVGGDGAAPGVFGRVTTENGGLFVAKLR